MTQYLLTVAHETAELANLQAMTPEEMQPMFDAVGAVNQKMQDAGVWVFAGGLLGPDVATTIDHRGDEPIITDGPYVEAKEYLGGLWILECPDLDAALDWARQGAKACQGKVEVRPFAD